MTKQKFIEKLEKSSKWEQKHTGVFTYKQEGSIEINALTNIDNNYVYITVEERTMLDPLTPGVQFMSDKRPYCDFIYCDVRNIIYADIDNRIALVL